MKLSAELPCTALKSSGEMTVKLYKKGMLTALASFALLHEVIGSTKPECLLTLLHF